MNLDKPMLAVVKDHSLEMTRRYRRNKPARKEGRGQVGETRVGGCSDGRSWIGEAFGQDPGVIGELTSIGAIYKLGWRPVGTEMLRWFKWCQEQDPVKRALFLPTYHFSGGGHGNCAGHHNDIDASIRGAWSFMEELRDCFHSDFLKSAVVGFDTDNDGAIFHSCEDPIQKVRILDYVDQDTELLDEAIATIYSGTHPIQVGYLQALAQSNLKHARQFRDNPREFEQVVHNENGILFGAGVSDWTMRDSLLRVGAYAPNMEAPLAAAAKIIAHNREQVPSLQKQRAVVLSTAPYFDSSGPEALVAECEAKTYNELARDVILGTCPELEAVTDFAVGIVHHNDRSLTIVQEP